MARGDGELGIKLQAEHAVAVDISSTDATWTLPATLYIGGAGDGTLKVVTAGGDTVSYAGVTVGFFPVLVTKVFKTGTGVTNIVKHY